MISHKEKYLMEISDEKYDYRIFANNTLKGFRISLIVHISNIELML